MEDTYEKIKLNKDIGQIVVAHGYELDPVEKYIINIEDELNEQLAIMTAVRTMGLSALKDYHEWLIRNRFNPIMPNPRNDFVSQFYGKKPLWKTDFSQGIVVKAENDGESFIVMECSRAKEGFKYTQLIVTLCDRM